MTKEKEKLKEVGEKSNPHVIQYKGEVKVKYPLEEEEYEGIIL